MKTFTGLIPPMVTPLAACLAYGALADHSVLVSFDGGTSFRYTVSDDGQTWTQGDKFIDSGAGDTYAVPRDGECAEIVIAVEMADAPAPDLWVNGQPISGTPVRGEKPRTYGDDRTSKTVWHYPVESGRIVAGVNRVTVRSIDRAVKLRWVEVAVAGGVTE